MARMSAASCGSLSSLRRRPRAAKFSRQRIPRSALVQPLLDGLAPPAEAAFGLAGVAVAELGGDLGVEGPAAEAGQPSGPGTDQGVERFGGGIHRNDPRW